MFCRGCSPTPARLHPGTQLLWSPLTQMKKGKNIYIYSSLNHGNSWTWLPFSGSARAETGVGIEADLSSVRRAFQTRRGNLFTPSWRNPREPLYTSSVGPGGSGSDSDQLKKNTPLPPHPLSTVWANIFCFRREKEREQERHLFYFIFFLVSALICSPLPDRHLSQFNMRQHFDTPKERLWNPSWP